MNQPLQLKLFGSPQIIYEGETLNGFVSVKVRALLIYLAVTARPHSRDHLAHLLWSDTPASMKVNLRKALSNLRQLIGDVLVEDGKELVALNPLQCWVDVCEYERFAKGSALRDATQLYQADFLSGFNLSLSYEFEVWTLGEQSRLKNQMIGLLRALAIQHEASANSSDAISLLKRLLELEPWHEDVHRWLMDLLARNGQRSAALAQFELCKRVLQEELAVTPDAETLLLQQKIQQATGSAVKPRSKSIAILKPEFPLIGRAQEWQLIQSAWQQSLQNGTQFVCIAGEAGIGKTRLTEEARLWVTQQGYASVYARSYAAEGALAYSPLVDWLRSDLLRPALEQLDAVWLSEVARLLPELQATHPHLAPAAPIVDNSQRRHFFEATARAIGAIDQPLLLVIDDLQWCDREMLEWLRFLLRFASSQPRLLLGAYRVEEVEQGHALHELLRSLRQTNQVTEFELNTLNVQETRKLIQLVSAQTETSTQTETGIESQTASLYHESSGHPLFVIESVRSRIGEPTDHSSQPRQNQHTSSQLALSTSPNLTPPNSTLPKVTSPKVHSVIQSRLVRLSAEARELAEIAATIGRAFSLQLLMLASKRDDEHLYRQLDELWQRRLIAEREAALFDLTHDRVREAVYAEISPIRRQRYHRNIAQGLTTIYATNLAPVSGRVASHYEQAGLFEPAITYYQQAATHAQQLSAHSEVAHYHQKTIQLVQQQPPSPANRQLQIDLLLALGQARMYTHARGGIDIGAAWHQAYELAKENGKPTQLCQAQIDLARHYRNEGTWLLSHQFAQDALTLAETLGDAQLAAQAGFALAVALLHQGKLAESVFYFEQVHTQTQAPTADSSLHGGNLLRFAHCLWLLGFPDQARLRALEALNFIRQAIPTDECMGLNHQMMVHYFCQDVAAVAQVSQELVALAPRYGEITRLNLGKLYHAWSLAHCGSSSDSDRNNGNAAANLSLIQTSIELVGMGSGSMFSPVWLGMLAEAKLLAGEVENALRNVEFAIANVKVTNNRYWLAHLLKLQGDLYCLQLAAPKKVEKSYQEALMIAANQNAKSLELRAANRLCRFWQQQGKQWAAYQLLAPLYSWFTEGFDTVDLIEAKQLLGEL